MAPMAAAFSAGVGASPLKPKAAAAAASRSGVAGSSVAMPR